MVSNKGLDDPTEITISDINAVTAALFSANALTISNVIEGANKFGTAPVRNAFFAMGNTNLQTSLLNVDGFLPSAQYPQQTNILETEFGTAGYMRFLLSSIGSVTLNGSNLGATVYNTFVAGMESYGVIEQNQYAAKFLNIYGNSKSSLIDLEALA